MPSFSPALGWHIHADRGGTFTDLIGVAPDGVRHSHKLLSHAPARYDDAVLAGVRALVGLRDETPIPEGMVEELRLGTTVTTNALLEGQHAPCALITNTGFEELLAVGDQSRPDIFALAIAARAPLCREVRGLRVRRAADGTLIDGLDATAVRDTLAALRTAGINSLAVALLHGDRYPEEEQRIAQMARNAGFSHCCCSHEVSPEPGLLERAQTAVVEAALAPILGVYLRNLATALPGARIRFMQSDGRLSEAAQLAARNSIFSGPAGGVIGATAVAEATRTPAIVGLDMGGTSTDVFACSGEPPVRDAATVAGQTVRAPALDLHTVAAGGGSRVFHDGQRMRVGPESAGADPGPACYARGGEATVTDANLLLGRLDANNFGNVFGSQGDAPLDANAAARSFDALACCDGSEKARFEAARGALQIANEHMAAAVRRISVARGVEIAGHSLFAFGGAGAQHACDVADALGLSSVRIPERASLLSAEGLGMAATGVTMAQAIDAELGDAAVQRARELLPDMRRRASEQLAAQHAEAVHFDAELRLHYAHGDTVIALPLGMDATSGSLAADFASAHEQQFGFRDPERPIRVAALRLRARDTARRLPGDSVNTATECDGTQAMMSLADGCWRTVPVVVALGSDGVTGPALVRVAQSSFALAPGWRAYRDAHGIHAERMVASGSEVVDSTAARLELFNARFMHIAAEMGEALRRSAQSVNVRNRLDYSCAIFDAEGHLIANAPHIPVHLGSMSASVQAVRPLHTARPDTGEAWLINDPYGGGTHLPDLTLVMPVTLEADTAASAPMSRHAPTTPISAAQAPDPCRRTAEASTRKASASPDCGRPPGMSSTTTRCALRSGMAPGRRAIRRAISLTCARSSLPAHAVHGCCASSPARPAAPHWWIRCRQCAPTARRPWRVTRRVSSRVRTAYASTRGSGSHSL